MKITIKKKSHKSKNNYKYFPTTRQNQQRAKKREKA